MSLSRDSRAEKKLKALRLAQFRLKQRFEMIDFCEDVLMKEVEAMKRGEPVLGIESGELFDLVHEDSDPT